MCHCIVHDTLARCPPDSIPNACAIIADVRTRVGLPLLLTCVSTLLLAGCGSSGASPTPSNPPPQSPPPQDPIPAIAGTWSGTFESPNLPPRAISFTIVQSAGYCIDGAWKDASSQWTGALSGVATSSAFSGQVSIEQKLQDGTLCSSVATIEGPMADTSLEWKVGAFSPTPLCPGQLPASGVLKLQKH